VEGWEDVVFEFMERQLTVESDKLLATPALADIFAQRAAENGIALKYLAGLFVRPDRIWSWIHELLWMPRCSGTTHRASTYRAPSWSWACLDGSLGSLRYLMPMAFYRQKCDVAFQVVDFGVDLSLPSAPYGRVTGAYLTVRGYGRYFSGNTGIRTSILEGMQPSRSLITLGIRPPSSIDLFLLPDTVDDKTTMEACLRGDEKICLLELVPPYFEYGKWQPVVGLVLCHAATGLLQTFRRVGLFVFALTRDSVGKDIACDFFEQVGDIKII
jgi:hypothetical protein